MRFLNNLKKLIIFALILTLLTGCGASLRNTDKSQNEPLDTLVKSENEENKTLSNNEENSSDLKLTPLPTYEPLTTEIPEGFCIALAKKSAQLMIEIEKRISSYGPK